MNGQLKSTKLFQKMKFNKFCLHVPLENSYTSKRHHLMFTVDLFNKNIMHGFIFAIFSSENIHRASLKK